MSFSLGTVIALFIVLVIALCSASPIPEALDVDQYERPTQLMYLLKRRDLALPFEVPGNLIQSMLKYRRY